jgi:ferredoxin-NADP reductase
MTSRATGRTPDSPYPPGSGDPRPDELTTGLDARAPGYEHRRPDEAFLAETIHDFNQHFYVCAPPGFMDAAN